MGKSARSWRRHRPAGADAVAIGALLLAAARPAAVITLPSQQETIILAMDVSGSMRAADVQAQPPGGRAGSRQDLRRRAAARSAWRWWCRSPAPRRSCSRRRTAATTSTPPSTASSCSAAPPPAAASCSLATIFPDAGIDLSQITGQKAGRRGPKGQAQARSRRWSRARTTRQRSSCSPTASAPPARSGGGGQDGGRPRRARLHGRHRHQGRDHRLRRLVDARAARRGRAQDRRPDHAPTTSTPAAPKT